MISNSIFSLAKSFFPDFKKINRDIPTQGPRNKFIHFYLRRPRSLPFHLKLS